MTLPKNIDPSELYHLMGAEALIAHIKAAAQRLQALGVEITPTGQLGIDEIEEAVVEFHARTNPKALESHLARVEGERRASASK